MKTLFLTIIIIIIGIGCNQKRNVEKEGNKKHYKMMRKHIKIDDSIIARRDPQAVIEPLWMTIDMEVSKKEYERQLEPYSFHQRAIFAIMWYMSEVNNGGHYQFYTNSTGIVWEDAMDGFELIGLDEGKKIIEESVKRFGTNPSFDRNEREKMLDSLDEDVSDLDSRFYKLDEKINITPTK
jgi:hypothetical protein